MKINRNFIIISALSCAILLLIIYFVLTQLYALPNGCISQGIGFIGNAIALMALILTLVGIFVTILAISVGDFRDYFLNAILICKKEGVEINVRLKEDIEKLLDKYNDSQKYLSYFYLIFIVYSLGIFFALILCVISFDYENMLVWLRQIIVIYSLSLIFFLLLAVHFSRRAANYKLLSKIQKEAASEMLRDIPTKDEEDITKLSKSLNTAIKNNKTMVQKIRKMLSAKELAVSGVF